MSVKLAASIAILASLIAAGSCGPAKTDGSVPAAATPTQAKGPPSTDGSLEPGLWRMDVAFEALEIPGMPKAIADTMKAGIDAETKTEESCMSAEEAKDGFTKIANEMNQGGDCKTAEFDNANGKVTARMSCGKAGSGGEMTMDGTYTSTSMDLRIIMQTQGEGDGANARMIMTVKGERIGECPA